MIAGVGQASGLLHVVSPGLFTLLSQVDVLFDGGELLELLGHRLELLAERLLLCRDGLQGAAPLGQLTGQAPASLQLVEPVA